MYVIDVDLCVVGRLWLGFFSPLQVQQHEVDLQLAGIYDLLIIKYCPHLREEEADKPHG